MWEVICTSNVTNIFPRRWIVRHGTPSCSVRSAENQPNALLCMGMDEINYLQCEGSDAKRIAWSNPNKGKVHPKTGHEGPEGE